MQSIGQPTSAQEILKRILSKPFGIDVSGPVPVVRSRTDLHTLSLDSVSSAGMLLLEARSREQYVQAVLTNDDSVEELRGTLFFLAGEVARRNQRLRKTSRETPIKPAHRNRPVHRTSTPPVVAA